MRPTAQSDRTQELTVYKCHCLSFQQDGEQTSEYKLLLNLEKEL